MKILVVGRGWTGNKVYKELNRRGHSCEIISHNEIKNAVTEYYDWVINAAGVTGTPNVDGCELIKAETYNGNALFPIELYNLCQKYQTKFAHFSSGCIYEGTIADVMADPNYFGSTYSISKGISDMFLKNKALVFRIRMPFTNINESKNYLSKVYKYSANGKLIDLGKNSMTDLDEAVFVACDLIEQDETGPFNLINQGAITMPELAEIMGIDNPQYYTKEEFAAVTRSGRSTCVIPEFGLMRPLRDALVDAISAMK
jgi:nucleoside-diphosphate-sugar epimerase